jgi:hypothetical protein
MVITEYDLRPMSDAVGDITNNDIIIYFDSDNVFVDDVYAQTASFNFTVNEWNYTRRRGYSIIGWIPVPKFKRVDKKEK